MFAGVASAAPPNWGMTVTKLPPAVSPGAPAGYQIDIVNNGPSNISALYLTADIGLTPVYLYTSQGSCNTTGSLFCSFGAVNDDGTVRVTVAFDTPTSGSTFPVTFQLNTTGVTFTDVKNRSHGDLKTVAVSTALNNSKNYAGFFSTQGDSGIGNNDVLTGNNKQSTRLEGLAPGFLGTVEDGPTTTGSCTTDLAHGIDCSQIEGEWSVVNVGDGGTAQGNFFLVIHYKMPGTPSAFLHSFAGGQERIDLCSAQPVAPCFTWDSSTSTAFILLPQNGNTVRLQ
jgi:hypothetical protein